MKKRLPVWLGILVAGTVLLGGCSRPPEPLEVATRLPQPRALPALKLRDARDEALSWERLHGRPVLLFFGFASCPEVCPTTLATLAMAARQLADLPSAQQPQVLFVSVDPLRDSPTALGAFAAQFGPEVIAATGERAALDELTHAVGTYYRIPDHADPARGYAVEHAGQVFVLDKDARLIAVVSPPIVAKSIARDLRRLQGLSGGAQ